jgi:hypothetical protein
MYNKIFVRKQLIDDALNNPQNNYLSISNIMVKLKQLYGICMKYSDIRYVLECSEYADEYFVDSSSHIKKYARLA